ncbi:MAG: hypothetical protein EBU89_01675 [Actinobacteria bacterium]|nr:hypothetical protein [Actinomycetota bacterium]
MINPVVQNYLASTGQMFIKAAESEDPAAMFVAVSNAMSVIESIHSQALTANLITLEPRMSEHLA